MRKIALAVSALLAVLTTYGAAAEDKFKLRASVDTSRTHGRTIALTDYLKPQLSLWLPNLVYGHQ
jgi:hypothetical protein